MRPHTLSLAAALCTMFSRASSACVGQDVALLPATPASLAETLPEAPVPVSIDPSGARTADNDTPVADTAPSLRGLPVRFLRDELAVVTSPARLQKADLVWLVPLGAASAASLATDTTAMRDVVSRNASFNASASTSSDVLRGMFIGAPVALYGGGLLWKNEHARESGLLGGEAMIDAYVAGLAIKYVTLRERPAQHNAGGAFFSGDAVSDPSFVSGHSVVIWSSAAVLAQEYSRPWQQAALYTLATGGSLTRVLAQQHFPTDVLLGSATGWLIGHYVYRVHHHFLKR